MSYLGAQTSSIQFSNNRIQAFSGNDYDTNFVLAHGVSGKQDVEITVNNVQQSPFDGSYNIVGGNTLVFSDAPSTGANNVVVYFRGITQGVVAPDANSVSSYHMTTTGVTAGTYGNNSAVPVVTVDAAGRVTNTSTANISGVTGATWTSANNTLAISTTTGDYTTSWTTFGQPIAFANTITTKAILPAANVTHDIGSATMRFRDIYLANSTIHIGNSAITESGGALSISNAGAPSVNLATIEQATNLASNAYSNAVATASADASSKAATAYSNAVSTAAADATTKAATAYTNAVSTSSTDATSKAATAYANAVSTAASDATTKAATAYTNAVSYANTTFAKLTGASFTGNVAIGSLSPTVSFDVGQKTDALRLPIGTTAQRPAGNTGYVRYNSNNNVVEEYNGSRWLTGNYPGSSPQNAANSAVEIWQAGGRGKGFFWLNSPNGGVIQNFCDLDTLDENGQSGWILVAMFPMAQNWRDDGLSTRQVLNPFDLAMNQNDGTPQPDRKMWSANWGDYQMNKFRIQNAWSAIDTGSNAAMDWYFHYTNACAWKQVWNFQAGTGNYMNDTSGDNNGNINAAYCSGWPAPTNTAGALPRCCLRGFNWAYNLKYSYQVGQRWNNLSDAGNGGTAQNTTYNWWAGLTQPHYTLGWGVGGDGSLAILPQGSTYTTAGQDCDSQNCKVGVDDTTGATMWASSAAASVTQTGLTDYYRSLYFWIK